MRPLFDDRADAGERLARHLQQYAGRDDVVILALPRGGVPVAYEIAAALDAPLDVFLMRKLGVPGHEELAMGAIASGGVRVLNESVVDALDVPTAVLDAVAEKERRELQRREELYRDGRPPVDVSGKIVIVVDDGLATGSTMRAAVHALRSREPKKLIVAVPVAAPETCEAFADEVDATICAETPQPFFGVGLWYRNFSQTSDDTVRELLGKAEQPVAARAS